MNKVINVAGKGVFLTVIFCSMVALAGLPVVCFAQESESAKMLQTINADIESLQGEWALENFNCFYESDATAIDIEQLDHEIYTELVLKNDSVFTNSKKQFLSGKYKIDISEHSHITQNISNMGNTYQISFSFLSAPFGICSVVNGDLNVQQRIENTQDKSKTMYILLTYKRK